jgi:hypothetical protein
MTTKRFGLALLCIKAAKHMCSCILVHHICATRQKKLKAQTCMHLFSACAMVAWPRQGGVVCHGRLSCHSGCLLAHRCLLVDSHILDYGTVQLLHEGAAPTSSNHTVALRSLPLHAVINWCMCVVCAKVHSDSMARSRHTTD